MPNYVAADTAPPAPRTPLVLYIGPHSPEEEFGGARRRLERGASLGGWLPACHCRLGRAGTCRSFASQARGARPIPASLSSARVYGEQKQKLLREARFMVLPSLSEGLPMAILEAWAAATPSLMSAACNLPEGFAQGAALETRVDSASIAATLRRAFALPAADWQAMSAAAHALAQSRFSPEAIAAQWAALYHRLAAGEYMSGP